MTKLIKQSLVFILIVISIVLTAGQCGKTQNTAPKNVIVMISDGWSFNHIDMEKYYYNEEPLYEKFPLNTAMSTYPKTTSTLPLERDADFDTGYDTDKAWSDYFYVMQKVTCSAASATAMATGTKTAMGAIGVDVKGKRLENLVEVAENSGKSTGVVTSVQFSHATPAGFSAHNITRGDYINIAMEMFLDSKMEVIMGCGHPDFDNNGKVKEGEKNYNYVGGIDTWKNILSKDTVYTQISNLGNNKVKDIDGDGTADAWEPYFDRQSIQNLATGETPKRVLVIPQVWGTLQQSRDGKSDKVLEKTKIATVPTLTEMAKAALNVLDNNEKGFFLMIEGGAVDWASHKNQAGRIIEEMHDFNQTVKAVVEWVEANSSWDETLLIVTGDHECGYLTGPNYNKKANLIETYPVVDKGKGRIPGHLFNSLVHTNQLIPFFAKGAGYEIFIPFADETDKLRGKYINNIELAQGVKKLWQNKCSE